MLFSTPKIIPDVLKRGSVVLEGRTPCILQLSTTHPFCLQGPADFTQFSVCVNKPSWGARGDEGQNDKETGEKERKAARKKEKTV